MNFNRTKPFRHEVAVDGGKIEVIADLFAGSDLEPNLALGINHHSNGFKPGDEGALRRHFLDNFGDDIHDLEVVFVPANP